MDKRVSKLVRFTITKLLIEIKSNLTTLNGSEVANKYRNILDLDGIALIETLENNKPEELYEELWDWDLPLEICEDDQTTYFELINNLDCY